MDPNETLAEIREILLNGGIGGRNLVKSYDNGNRLAELVEALDNWISRGGFLPDAWAKAYAKSKSTKTNESDECKASPNGVHYFQDRTDGTGSMCLHCGEWEGNP
jgi:hypothetical protein